MEERKIEPPDLSLAKDEFIYQKIYTAIVEYKLLPDAKLTEDALAEVFSVSRTIIRKVLLRLTHEGLVKSAPKRGARVARPSTEEGQDVFEARRLIEVAALPLILERMTDLQLAKLRRLDNEQKAAQADFDFQAAIRLSGHFHQALMDIAGNKALSEFLRNLISQSSLIVAVYGSSQQHLSSCQGHSDFLALLEQKQLEACQRWMGLHLSAVESTLNFGSSEPDEPDLKAIFS